ncbi:putative bifunctional P-450:NADPH-P450 reductase [Ophiocordyceps camponoti-floridani]|uniref:Putative bifunctional P-450:NADPH-P450 reductase n=1 Tax=Ophiocordyceps camponoti-floridani TaxID=2030778 RepID=A0A8H4Q0E8_9HYPO|nr:putative bifunctional P-450:NADPH-P450 reductase [Ophiocordyceps camponoti-floridani]
MTIDETRPTSLPTGKAINVSSTLGTMVELGQPVSNRVAIGLAKTIPEEKLVKELEARAAEEDFQADKVTLLHLLEDYPTATFTFGHVVDAPARGSRHGHRFLGVASSSMERLEVGERIQISIRPSRNGFHLPTDDSKPIIMACAGTGLAPFRAFVAERALKKGGGRELGPALLFYGCSRPEDDDLYRDELDEWEAEGAVSVRRAYSKQPDASKGCKYVQDRLWLDRVDVRELYAKGAQLYCCGAGAVGSAVEDTMVRIKAEVAGCDEETAYKWVQERKGDRYYSDIFS